MVDFIITAMCLQLNSTPEMSKYYSACVHAIQAASIKYEIKPMVDGFEQKMTNKIKDETGEQIWWIMGTGYAFTQKGEINLNIGARPVVDTIQFKIDPKKESVNTNLIWEF